MSQFSRRNFVKSAGLLGFGAFTMSSFNVDNQIDLELQSSVILPKRLTKGDLIAVTAPGGAIWNPNDVLKFESLLKSMGYSVVLGETLKKRHGYLAGTDEERVEELHRFFSNPEVRGIICMRGGWGCARLLDKIDFNLIRENPKIFMGFSDITSLLNAFYLKSGLVTFHGLVGVNTWNGFSTDVFQRVVCNGDTCDFPKDASVVKNYNVINKGVARGKLFGGNLSVISGIVGSSYFQLPPNSILFLEETNEEPYVVDRLLTHLRIANVYQNVVGVIFGNCSKCNAENPAESMSTIEVIREHFSGLNIPVSYGSPIGHIASKWTLPIGIDVEMNAETGSLVMLENAVL
jgi:muramoyltetrapeptide carboxypeptidase